MRHQLPGSSSSSQTSGESDLSLWEEKLVGSAAHVSSPANYYVTDLQRGGVSLTCLSQQLAAKKQTLAFHPQQLAADRHTLAVPSEQLAANRQMLACPPQQLVVNKKMLTCHRQQQQLAASRQNLLVSYPLQQPVVERDNSSFADNIAGGSSNLFPRQHMGAMAEGSSVLLCQQSDSQSLPYIRQQVSYSSESYSYAQPPAALFIGGKAFYLLEAAAAGPADLYEDVDSDYGDTAHSTTCLAGPAGVSRTSRALPSPPLGQ